MRAETIQIYTFDELAESVQERVLDKNREINVDYAWYDYIFDDWKDKLADLGYLNAKIEFSGFNSQGDGASFMADIDHDKLVLEGKFAPLEKYRGELSFFIKEIPTIYSHEHTKCIKSDCFLETDELDILISEYVDFLNEKRVDLCHEIYKELETQYEYLISNEAVKETLIANEYEFTEDGEIY